MKVCVVYESMSIRACVHVYIYKLIPHLYPKLLTNNFGGFMDEEAYDAACDDIVEDYDNLWI